MESSHLRREGERVVVSQLLIRPVHVRICGYADIRIGGYWDIRIGEYLDRKIGRCELRENLSQL